MTVGERIKERRKTLGLTQKALAERMNKSRGWLEHIERGRRVVPSDYIARLSRTLGLPEADLVPRDLTDRPLDMVSE